MIVQFGTSRFLQAHVDLMASQARDAGQDVPPITIVQTTGDAERARRLVTFADAEGFPVILRGIEAGKAVDQTVQVRSVIGGISAVTDWPPLVELVAGQARFLVSNTGDTGYHILLEDRERPAAGQAPGGFVPKLTALLHARWQWGGAPITLLPCELVPRNGDVLRGLVLGLARDWGLEQGFAAWLESCLWISTLVDRIVSTPLEPAGAVAEPYALWAVERQPGLVMPFTHPQLVLTDDLEPFERLKLHILNLGHTWLAQQWHEGGADPALTVRAMMEDGVTLPALLSLYVQEVVPGFAMRGLGKEAEAYVETTLDRFANPYLDHRLADIYSHHRAKIERRVTGFIDWVRTETPDLALPRLEALAHSVSETAA
ncbi:mannitol dehydrogenase family protein [Novosphingobium rosa]|uniref:mannitol dehydrogenase family protein n=1 Tax=Novosphingobium rosa TaxID=76978 RepID=UPI000A89B77A|nr:mannitol dehydrogenase family protein [Novosphingobium rosa]